MNVQYYDTAPPSGNASISFTIEDLTSSVNDSSSSGLMIPAVNESSSPMIPATNDSSNPLMPATNGSSSGIFASVNNMNGTSHTIIISNGTGIIVITGN